MVTPTFHGVIIAFKARLNAPATVAIGTGTPAGEPKQLPATIVQLNAQQNSKSSGKVGDFLVAYPELEQGKTYSYLVTVPALDGTVRQRSGTFTTLGQRARVVFTYITVQSDSDEDSSGDLWFRIAAVSEDPKARNLGYAEVGQIGSPIQWESGSRRKVSAEFTVENAPYRLRLLVLGVDDDRNIAEISSRGPGAGMGRNAGIRQLLGVELREGRARSEPGACPGWKHPVHDPFDGLDQCQTELRIRCERLHRGGPTLVLLDALAARPIFGISTE